MSRSNPLTWRNIGQPSFSSGSGLGVAARAFESAGRGFREASDYARARRTDQALADLMADGVISRGELGGLEGVDMKTILDAQRLDQTAREQSTSRGITDRLNRERVTEAARKNSPTELARVRAREDAADALAQTRAETAAARLELDRETAELTRDQIRDRNTARQSYQDGLTSTLEADFAKGGQYNLEQMEANWALDFHRRNGRPVSQPELQEFREEYKRIRPDLERRAVNAYTQDFMNQNPVASQYISDLPGVAAYQSSLQTAEQAAATISAQATKEANDMYKNLRSASGFQYLMYDQNGSIAPSQRKQTIDGSVSDATARLLSGYGLKSGSSRADVKAFDFGVGGPDFNEKNEDGMARVIEAAGRHSGIIEKVMANKIRDDGGVFNGKKYVDSWQAIVDEARDLKKAMEAQAELTASSFANSQAASTSSPLLNFTGRSQ